jgi:hypothetical protein
MNSHGGPWELEKGKTYTDIIQSASRPNPDVDKLLGGFGDWLNRQPTEYLQKHKVFWE